MSRETVIEQKAVKLAEAHGWLVRKVAYIGRRGAPDRWFFRAGRLVMIEFKRPGLDATLQQQREHDRLRAAGFEVYVCATVDEAAAVLGI